MTIFPRRGFPSRLVTAAIGCALLAACSRGTDERAGDAAPLSISGRPPVLLITLDTTRPDHLEPYGAAGAETPALAGLARDGIVFEHAFATAPVTAPSHASILTGLYPPRHGVRNNLTHHLGDGIPTLAGRLSAAGYRTAAFVSAIVLERRYGLDRGFEVYDDEIRAAGASRESRMTTERRAEDTADRALQWLDGLGGETPFFLWVHFYDPHLPFSPPSPWAERFAERPYDGEIAYMDTQVARLLEHPRVADGGALVIAMGDHGEGLGEHGEEAHGLLIYDSTIRVPWLMRLPGGPSGLRVEAPVSQVDLVPTLIELLSLEPEAGGPELEGRSLRPLLAGGGSLPERLLFAESEVPFFSYGWARLRSAYQWPLKLIDAPVAELYDIERDPNETRNLAPESATDTRRLAAAIESWAGADAGSGSTVGVDPEAEAQLRALGYLAGDTQRPAGEGRGNPVELMPVHDELQVVGTMLAEGRPREALERVQVALAMDPDNLAALRDLSRALTQMGRLDEAAEAATRAREAAPWSARALQVEAEVEHRRGRTKRALELIDRALELDGRFLEARLDRCRYLAELGRNDEAVSGLETLLAEHPDNTWVALRYAELVELPAGEYAEAERRLRAVLAQNPYIAEAWSVLATVLQRDGRPSEAVEVYRQAMAGGGVDSDVPARFALLLAELGSPEAEAALREAIASSAAPRADLHVALGDALAARGRRSEARQQYELAAAAPTYSAGTRNARAMALLQLDRAAEAASIWRDLTREQPGFAKAWLNLSSLAIRRGDWGEVERFARAAVERDPESSAGWNNLAIGLEELGRAAEAEAAYRRAIAVEPAGWRARFNLGILLRKSARYPEAAELQRETLERAPSHAGAHFELGMLLAGPLGDPVGARSHLQTVIDLEPGHPRARQARAVLDQLPR